MARYGLIAAALCAFAPWTRADASGFESEYPDNHARALGRAGAMTASVADPSAIYFNPAGLAKLSGFQLLLSANLVDLQQSFRPDATETTQFEVAYAKAENDGGRYAAPFFAGHFDFASVPWLDFGFGIYGPPDHGRRRYPRHWQIAHTTDKRTGGSADQRIAGDSALTLQPNGLVVENDLVLAYPTLAAAITITEGLRIGVSLQDAILFARIQQGTGGAVPAVAEIDVTDWFTPTAVIGIQYQPISSIEIGVSFRPGFHSKGEGKANLHAFAACPAPDDTGACPTSLAERRNQPLGPYDLDQEVALRDDDGTTDEDVTFEFNSPMVVRTGLRYVHRAGPAFDAPEIFDIELDWIYERNSAHEYFETTFGADNVVLPLGGGEVVVPLEVQLDRRNYRDTHALRLGGDWHIIAESLTIRSGISWSQGSSPDAYANLDFPGLDQYAVAVGATYRWGAFDFDFGVSHAWSPQVNVDDSRVTILDVQRSESDWDIVGNGAYEAAYTVIGVGTTLRL